MSDNGQGDRPGRDRWDEALTWYSTLRDGGTADLTDAIGRKWQQWYSDGENQRVFDDVSRLLARRDLYRKRSMHRKGVVENDRYDPSVPVAEWLKGHGPREPREWRPSAAKRKSWLSGGIGIGVAAIALLFILLPLRIWVGDHEAAPFIYQTGVGELKDVHLSDGSSITLGGLTEISVAFSGKRRSVRLIKGQAWFKVAHDSQWPFVVSAGNGMITDIGTAFVVTLESDRVVVAVTDGTVEVGVRTEVPQPPAIIQRTVLKRQFTLIHVTQGEELTLGDHGSFGQVRPTDIHAVTAWIHGRLIFDDIPLRYVVEAVNRYSTRRIVVSPAAGVLRFGGVVYDDEIQDWLNSLGTIFPVVLETRSATVRIHMRHPTSATGRLPAQAQP